MHFFPSPYSSDLNPIEQLWLLLKAQWSAGSYAKSLDELIERLTMGLRWLIDRIVENIKDARFRQKFIEPLYLTERALKTLLGITTGHVFMDLRPYSDVLAVQD